MCLPNFKEFKQIDELNSLIGYRNWRVLIKEPNKLISEYVNHSWLKKIEGPHEVLDKDSGIYSYNNNNYYNNNYYYYNNYYYNYYYDNNYNYNNNYNYYYLFGIIKQFGKVAIHEDGYRSEYAIIDTLFTIRLSDAKGTEEFLSWIKKFNNMVEDLASFYGCKTQHHQDFVDLK